MQLKPGLWISPARLLAEICSIGYVVRPSDVRLTLTGTIIKQGDRLTLRLGDIKPAAPTFALIPGEGGGHKAKKLRGIRLGELEIQTGKSVEVEGYWREAQKDRPPTLLVIRCTSKPNE